MPRSWWVSRPIRSKGAAGVEYAILLAGVAALMISIALLVGFGVEEIFQNFSTQLSDLTK